MSGQRGIRRTDGRRWFQQSGAASLPGLLLPISNVRLFYHCTQEVADMASISMGFQKPNGLKYNDIMDEYGAALANDPQLWSDISLLPLVKCQYIRERIRDSLFNLQTSGSPYEISPFQAEMNVQAFYNEVEEWKSTVPDGIKSMRMSSITNAQLRFLTHSHSSHNSCRTLPNHQHLQPRPRLLPAHPGAARATP